MKQGPSKNSYEPKTEPIAKAVNPVAVAEFGKVNGPNVQLYQGRGLEAPVKGETVYSRGSQGKHK